MEGQTDGKIDGLGHIDLALEADSGVCPLLPATIIFAWHKLTLMGSEDNELLRLQIFLL